MSVDANHVCMAHCALLLACTELAHLVWSAVHGDGLLAWTERDGLLTGQTFNGAHFLMQSDTDLHIRLQCVHTTQYIPVHTARY